MNIYLTNIKNDVINIELCYKNKKNNQIIKESHSIIPIEIQPGEEISKLIINNYIMKSNIIKQVKTQIALKYQLLTEFISLFTEIEFSEKVTENMKLEILGDKEHNIILDPSKRKYEDDECYAPAKSYSRGHGSGLS